MIPSFHSYASLFLYSMVQRGRDVHDLINSVLKNLDNGMVASLEYVTLASGSNGVRWQLSEVYSYRSVSSTSVIDEDAPQQEQVFEVSVQENFFLVVPVCKLQAESRNTAYAHPN